MPINLSRYRQCQECKKPFILPKSAKKIESKNKNTEIFCPYCHEKNIAIISLGIYLKLKGCESKRLLNEKNK